MPLDFTRPIQTRDGRAVEILRTAAKHRYYPVVALVTNKVGDQVAHQYTECGKVYYDISSASASDLVNVPPRTEKRTGWVNVYEVDQEEQEVRYCLAETKAQADALAANDRIACVEIEYEAPAE